jgi:hypothetical protein
MSGAWGNPNPYWPGAMPGYAMGAPSVGQYPMGYCPEPYYNGGFVGASCGNYVSGSSGMEAPMNQPLDGESSYAGGDLPHDELPGGVKGIYRSNGEWVPVDSEAAVLRDAGRESSQPNEDQQAVTGCDDARMQVPEASTRADSTDSDGCLNTISAAETPVSLSVVTTPDKDDAKASKRGHDRHGQVKPGPI